MNTIKLKALAWKQPELSLKSIRNIEKKYFRGTLPHCLPFHSCSSLNHWLFLHSSPRSETEGCTLELFYSKSEHSNFYRVYSLPPSINHLISEICSPAFINKVLWQKNSKQFWLLEHLMQHWMLPNKGSTGINWNFLAKNFTISSLS